MTNYEKIMNNMTVDKMANYLLNVTSYDCDELCPLHPRCNELNEQGFDCDNLEKWKEWLNAEVSKNTGCV